MKKSQKIIILKAKVIKLKAKLKEAQMELAKWDSIKPIESTDQLFTTERVNESIKDLENEIKKTHKEQFSHFQELFEHLHNEHGLILVEGEMWEIINIVRKIDDTSTKNDDTLTIDQLKEGDVLVCNESFDIFEKGIEYPIIDIQYLGLVVKTGDSRYSKLKDCLDKFTLKAKPSEEETKSRFDYDQEPITSTTLKTPNEWLKLMSEEEVKQWKENVKKTSDFDLDMNKEICFDYFINESFEWNSTLQGQDYWQNLSNRYNN
jgi:hypothetical protein